MIDILRPHVPLSFLCHYFGVSRSGYYKWKLRVLSPCQTLKEIICKKIEVEFNNSKNTYGSPRIYQELRAQGVKVSENTVAKYMNELGLDARFKKKFRVVTTDSNHNGPIADRVFKSEEALPEEPGAVLAGDITYLRLGSSFIYLAVVMDLYNREIIGWSISSSLKSKLVVDALKMAFTRCDQGAQIIFHSDRGSQYASEVFLHLLSDHHVIPSMSRKGNCYDNCYVESWFKSLKSEWIYRHQYEREEELRGLVFEYIETWYNRKRRHSSLDYLSPVDYKLQQNIA